MRIGARILWTLLGMGLLVTLLGALAIHQQRSVGLLEAKSEAEEDARVIAFIAAQDQPSTHAFAEKLARYIYGAYGRDTEVVDARKRIIADSHPEEVGRLSDHRDTALDSTFRDGQVRTFLEPAGANRPPAKEIVVPVQSESGQTLGTVTEEYTPIYDEFMAITAGTTSHVVLAALAGVLTAVILTLHIGASIARPLRQLTGAATAFAHGRPGGPMPPPRNDEIGELAAAFNIMMERRRDAESAQALALQDLAEANARLRVEVAERRHAEEIARDSEERVRQLADDLAQERKRLSDILDSMPAVVFENWPLHQGRRSFVNRQVQAMYGYTQEEWLSAPDFWTQRVHPDDRDAVLADAKKRFADGGGAEKQVFRWITRDNRVIWGETYLRLIRNGDGIPGVRGFTVDITEKKLAELELEQLHHQLVETSREAGMAEVATSVLHNVGNVLNSVNISATLAADQVRQSSAPHLARVVSLLQENSGNLGAFLSTNTTGQKLPVFLDQLARQLEAEHAAVLRELETLGKNVEHIKDIVSVQQNYASTAGVTQSVAVVDLVEDSLRMNTGALTRHDVQLTRDFEVRPLIQVDKHKVMQILVNLIRNAKYACDESGCPNKLLTMRIAGDDLTVRISVADNGVGIPAENLTRIFSHGFTTRQGGHGFGLHSGALAAREMGGSLSVHSTGSGCGATFTLELPTRPPARS